MKKIVSVVLIIVMLLSFASCSIFDVRNAPSKDFTVQGMTITLTSGFEPTEIAGFTTAYDSSKVAVFVLKEEFSLFEGEKNMNFDRYVQFVLSANSETYSGTTTTEDGLTYFEYEAQIPDENITYKYLVTLFQGTDAYWMIQFTTRSKDYADYRADFFKWAKTVRFE